MKVFVYFNLHKKCWSVKALEGKDKGRVIKHTDAITLKDCEFRVSEAGRQRVLREKRKNVHAGVVGHINLRSAWKAASRRGGTAVSYNPYKAGHFVEAQSGAPIHTARRVEMHANAKTKVCAFA